jgi:hypothetical protein
MKVRELIQDLLLADGDLEVVLASDAEGNSFAPMDSQIGWSFEFLEDRELADYFDEHGEREYNALVLWPV